MKTFLAIILILSIASCQQPVAYVQPATPMAVAPAAQPYTTYADAYGNPATVYYTDPYTHASYWLEYAMFMSMWNNPNRYTVIHHYYDANRSYITSRNSYYSSNYGRNVYRPSSPKPGSNTYRPSSPSPVRPSSPSPYRPSSPTQTRPMSPSPRPSYSPSPSHSSRPSSPRH